MRFKLPVLIGGVAVGVALVAALALSVRQSAEHASGEEDYDYLSTGDLQKLDVRLGGTDAVRPTGQVKEFTLVAEQVEWELLPGVMTTADTFNGAVPGPTIRITEGDTVRVTVKNELPQETSIHWHGLHVPNEMDGVAGITQDPIMPGETFTYEFIASHAGTFMYHSHSRFSREQIDRGLYGALIIDPQESEEPQFDREYTLALQGWMVGPEMEAEGPMAMDYNYFTINGKSYPATDPLVVKEGDVVRLRFINPSQTIHPMHLHGQDFKVVAKDGEPLADPWIGNTLDVEQGETYDVVFIANNPGTWVLHCHDLHHASNNGVEPGGLIQVIQYEGVQNPIATEPAEPSPSPTPLDMPGMGAAPVSPSSSPMAPDMPGMGSEPVSPTPSPMPEDMPGMGGMAH